MEARVLQQMRGESNGFGAATLEDTNEKRTHISEVDAGGFELRGDVFVPTSICCLPYHAFQVARACSRGRDGRVSAHSSRSCTSGLKSSSWASARAARAGGLADVEAHFPRRASRSSRWTRRTRCTCSTCCTMRAGQVGGAFLQFRAAGH